MLLFETSCQEKYLTFFVKNMCMLLLVITSMWNQHALYSMYHCFHIIPLMVESSEQMSFFSSKQIQSLAAGPSWGCCCSWTKVGRWAISTKATDLERRAKITKILVQSQLFGCLHATLNQFHTKHVGGLTEGRCGSSNFTCWFNIARPCWR